MIHRTLMTLRTLRNVQHICRTVRLRRWALPLVGIVGVLATGWALAASSPVTEPASAEPWLPRETGEAAFASLAEIVARLDADPATDWERVSIRTLREHLVDMHHLVTEAVVEEREVGGGFSARVTGDGATREALHRMVPAHGRMLTALGYEVSVETFEEGVTFTVREGGSEPAPGRVARLRGLGFFGVMALGNHHRPHHKAMATGQRPASHRHPEEHRTHPGHP